MKKIFLSFCFMTALLLAAPVESLASVEIIEQDVATATISQPTSSTLRVANANGEMLYIYNVAGKCIKSFRVEGPDHSYELNLPKGIYIVKVGQTARRITVK